MVIATHLIKIKGSFDQRNWTEKKLEEFVKQKIKKIDPSFHADLELFQVQDGNIEVWVYISAFPSEVSEFIVSVWIKTHLKEDGVEVKKFEIKVITNVIESLKADSPNQAMIRLP